MFGGTRVVIKNRPDTMMLPAIVALQPGELAEQAATLLYRSFRGRTDSFPDLAAAQREGAKSIDAEKISPVAVDPEAGVVGWIGALPQYRRPARRADSLA